MLNKIKHSFKLNWNDYRYHTVRMNTYFSESTLDEQIVWVILSIGLLYGSYYQVKLLLPLNFMIAGILLSLDAYKVLQELKYCYKDYIKPNILCYKPIITLFRCSFGIFISIFLKFVKPLLKFILSLYFISFACVGIFEYIYGFNPIREYALVKFGKQTSEQAWYHIMNPSKYSNLNYPPYLEDLNQDNIKKEILIEKLKKQLEEIHK